MSMANSKTPSKHEGFEWAGAMARIKRTGAFNRSGRRSVLLGMMNSSYANAGRGTRSGESRGANTDRS